MADRKGADKTAPFLWAIDSFFIKLCSGTSTIVPFIAIEMPTVMAQCYWAEFIEMLRQQNSQRS
ncbi:hypothetical protein K5D51_20585 [Pseudomonas cichorii]|nr:hypothetical protein [Pseudomonas cichorii]MBX8551958.1 hypothetical protein [Pseudomonas cichorii]MBX8561755.1 hypothetical protein [Pseudomonas cichorii]MBX8581974.1 hypothetical protein [Pseudomonas cichorii]MBX8586167.1 hypothetical protein [Pseudomonas cichorii]